MKTHHINPMNNKSLWSCLLVMMMALMMMVPMVSAQGNWPDYDKTVELFKAWPNTTCWPWKEVPKDACTGNDHFRCSSDNVVTLDFSNCNLTGTLPPVLFQFPQVFFLLLANNSLTGTIPKEIGSSAIAFLNFNHNQLEGTIPEEIFNHRWVTLLLSYNRLSGVFPKSSDTADDLSQISLECNHGLDLCSLTYNRTSLEGPQPICSVSGLTNERCTDYWKNMKPNGCNIVENCPAPPPIDPVPVPIDPTPVPIDPTPVPIDPSPVPIDPTPVPIDPTPVPIDPTPVPVAPPSSVPVTPIGPAPTPNRPSNDSVSHYASPIMTFIIATILLIIV